LSIVLLPDAGPLITLAYANSLDLLVRPGWPVQIVDMVLHEVTRNQTPSSGAIERWVNEKKIEVLPTEIFRRYRAEISNDASVPRRNNLGELASQEVMNSFALVQPPQKAVFLFEDHRIARASFLLPENCEKISTRAFLLFLEQKAWIESAASVEQRAIAAGRMFSQLRYPS
jgi:hypothetical protein